MDATLACAVSFYYVAGRLIFATHVDDWASHEEKVGRFWRNALLFQRDYNGNPMQVHKAAGNVESHQFAIWLSLFDIVLKNEFPPALANAWSKLAHRIGCGLSIGLFGAEYARQIPNLQL